MAGDWIKMRISLADDPAVISIANNLDLEEFAVVGRLHQLWSWADSQSRDGHASGVTTKWINRYLQCDGFAESMIAVGWLSADENGITIPNFDRHNGETAKTRALSGNRKKKQRSSVTDDAGQVSRTERDKSVTREEKRREEQNLSLTGEEPVDKSASEKTPDDTRRKPMTHDWQPDNRFGFQLRAAGPPPTDDELLRFRSYWIGKGPNTDSDWIQKLVVDLKKYRSQGNAKTNSRPDKPRGFEVADANVERWAAEQRAAENNGATVNGFD